MLIRAALLFEEPAGAKQNRQVISLFFFCAVRKMTVGIFKLSLSATQSPHCDGCNTAHIYIYYKGAKW